MSAIENVTFVRLYREYSVHTPHVEYNEISHKLHVTLTSEFSMEEYDKESGVNCIERDKRRHIFF